MKAQNSWYKLLYWNRCLIVPGEEGKSDDRDLVFRNPSDLVNSISLQQLFVFPDRLVYLDIFWAWNIPIICNGAWILMTSEKYARRSTSYSNNLPKQELIEFELWPGYFEYRILTMELLDRNYYIHFKVYAHIHYKLCVCVCVGVCWFFLWIKSH